jgi:hypothetical protein
MSARLAKTKETKEVEGRESFELTDLHFRAAEETGLAAEYANDPELLRFYMRKLLKKGWAGNRTQTEKHYCSAVYRLKGGTNPFAKTPALPHAHEGTDASSPGDGS